ncbi:MAG TPA: DUF2934 domain-containing protein [Candidatus Limnocylindrales bacterium]|nr:DUF2934 domain-containing protein [Candidatus Limnocylindrales bacterium]
MTTNTDKTQFSGSQKSGSAKPTLAAAAGAFLRNPLKKANAAPSEAEISTKAYEIWLSTGQQPGHDQEHWFQAEQQLSST